MIRDILYSILLVVYMPLMGMNNEHLQITLNAPEYWKHEGDNWVQCDLDENGDLCQMGSRNYALESEYVKTFAPLKQYLATTHNRFIGFDPKMFALLKDCLQLSYLHQTAETPAEKRCIEIEVENLFDEPKHSPSKLIDAVYVSRFAGLSMIEKLACQAFSKRKINGRPIRIDDVYPSFDSLDEIGPNVSDTSDQKCELSSGLGLDSEAEESFESESATNEKMRIKVSAFASLFAWMKSFFATHEISIATQTPKMPKMSAIATTELCASKSLSLRELLRMSKKIDAENAEKKSKLEQESLVNQSWMSRLKRILWTLFCK
ncbi:MAG: hypothetical protein AMXMBFR12_08750 [Candidatus Babeliales bacterium]